MGRALATTVILVDENGQPVVFNAGDEPAKKWADQIDNPKAWAGKAKKSDEDDDAADTEGDDVEDDDTEDQDGAPAKSAKVADWQAYAESKGIELDDTATKKDYQDAVAAL